MIDIIMYHYVRPIKNSAYPKIKGLELDSFKKQIEYLLKNKTIVDTAEVISCFKNKKKV